MKEFLEQYYHNHYKKGSVLKLNDFYKIYVAIETYYGRTPVSYYKYKSGFYYYFKNLYKFMIRVNWVFHMMYRLGTIKVSPINLEKGWYKFVWRKGHRENTRFTNQEIYCFKPSNGGSVTIHGKGGLRIWLREIRKRFDLTWYETIE